jgi:hypothetical protein
MIVLTTYYWEIHNVIFYFIKNIRIEHYIYLTTKY